MNHITRTWRSRRPRFGKAGEIVATLLALFMVPLLVFGIAELYHPQFERQALANLEEIARLKTGQIENWLHERNSDAQLLLVDGSLAQEVAEQLRTGTSANWKHRQAYFDRLREVYGYAGVCLLGLDRTLLLGSGDCVEHPGDTASRLRALTPGVVTRGPLYLETQDEIHLDWLVPIAATQGKKRPLAALLLRAHAHDFLYPLIQSWPTASASGESLLVRREGDNVVFLNDLRFREHTALTLTQPLTTRHLPAAAAVLADSPGTLVGDDYRGIPVVSAFRPVAGTDWKLVAKVDHVEVVGPLTQLTRWMAAISSVAALLISVALRKYRRERRRVASLIDAAREAKIELERQAAALQFASVFNLSPIAGIISQVEDGRVIQINDNLTTDFGWTKEQLIGRTSVETALWDAATRQRFMEALGHKERLTGYDTIWMTQDARARHVSLSSVITEMGGQRCLLTFATDVTESRAAQTQLVAAEASLKAGLKQTLRLLDSMMDAVICMDQQGRVTAWNTHAELIFGYPAEQALGRLVEELIVPPAYRERHRQGMARFVRTGEPQIIGKRMELPAMRADGTEFPIELTLGSIGVDGEFIFSAAARDITERQAFELHLKKLSVAIEQSTSSVAITDVDGHIEYVNDAFIRTTGYSREEVTGQNPRILHSGFTPRETYIDLWTTLTQGKIWRGELFNKSKDGHLYTESAQITPLHDANGIVTNYIAVKEDITERKRLVDELSQHREHLELLVTQRTEELHAALQHADEATQAKSAFLANMSHEIRTPMNAVVGFAYALRRSPLASEQRQQLDKITAAAEHLLTIINDILDLSKIESTKLELEQIDFDLGMLFDNVSSMMQDDAQKKGLTFKVDYPGVPLWLRGDPTRLRQSLLNFTSNAIKFTSAGFIDLRARVLEDSEAGLLIRFEVEDSGSGISSEDQARLFTAFEQADASTTRKHGGTGLGLAITRHLAQLMGGDAGVSSQPGCGSTFWFTAHLQRGHENRKTDRETARSVAADDAEITLKQFAGARILLADDIEMNRELCITLLHDSGLIIDTAADGREAVNKAALTDYAAILMDMQMPELDGLEATRTILKLPGREKTAIIAMTANAFTEDHLACKASGMVDYLTKPIAPERLYQTLVRWLSKSAARGSPPAATSAAVAAQPVTPTHAGGEELPGLDVVAGTSMWCGQVASYQKFLVQFSEVYADAPQTLQRAVQSGDQPAAAALAHKLKGSAGNMAVTEVARIAGEIERLLNGRPNRTARHDSTTPKFSPEAGSVSALLLALEQAMTTALSSIARYAATAEEAKVTTSSMPCQ